MQIKTITCHDVYNYGASLQAYALQTFLEEHGHNVEIIDYLPEYKHLYDYFKAYDNGITGAIKKRIPFLEPVMAMIQHRQWYRYVIKIIRFKHFKRNYLYCTDIVYRNFAELEIRKPKADLFIAGSDQIWNPVFGNGLDPAFYLMFEKDTSKCISYAASFGVSSISDYHRESYIKWLNHFRSISIRETSGVELAKSLGFDSVNVLDPVFLLTKKQWNGLRKKNHKESYLLVYDFTKNDENLMNMAIKIAKERKLKIYSFFYNGSYIDKVLNTCGPIEFIEWIACADMVISNSFHATAFSVIFERDFYTVPLKGYENSSRMKDFLSLIGLESRFVYDVSNLCLNKIDFDRASYVWCEYAEKSRKWLLDNLL